MGSYIGSPLRFWMQPELNSKIEDCCKEAVSIAQKLDVAVSFQFNGVTVHAFADSDSDTLYGNYIHSFFNPVNPKEKIVLGKVDFAPKTLAHTKMPVWLL